MFCCKQTNIKGIKEKKLHKSHSSSTQNLRKDFFICKETTKKILLGIAAQWMSYLAVALKRQKSKSLMSS